MEITEVIKHSIKHPNDGTLNSLPEYIQAVIYSVTTYCIDNNKGKVKKAHKINKLIIPIIRNRLHYRKKKNIGNNPVTPPTPPTPPEISERDPPPTPPEISERPPSSPPPPTPPTLPEISERPPPPPTPPEISERPPSLHSQEPLVKTYVKRAISTDTSSEEERVDKGYTEYDERGFRSSITSFVMLKEENIGKNMCVLVHFNNSQSPGIKVYFDIDTSIREPMYSVYQHYKQLGADSRHNLYGEDLIEYIEEILLRKNNSGSFKFKITKINIDMYNEINRFYIHSLGIVWNHEECADCHIKKLTGLELSSRCNTLIRNKCEDNFTNVPKPLPKAVPKPLPKGAPKAVPKGAPKAVPKGAPKAVPHPTQSINKKSSKIQTDQRGVNSMIMACKEVLPKFPESTVEVYINDSSTPEFKITYTSTSDTPTHLNGAYKIVKSRDEVISTLRFEALKQYIHSIFDKNSKKQYTVSKINLILLDGSGKRFYIESLGIVWNNDQCTDCVLQERAGELTGPECKDLLRDKCYNKFKYRKDT